LEFQKLDLVVKVDGWNLAFRVEGQVSVFKFEAQNQASGLTVNALQVLGSRFALGVVARWQKDHIELLWDCIE
jgi:hypothetical protein